MRISKVLTSSWYPRFVPKTPVNSFKIAGRKILVLNSDTVPGKPLLCKRHGDDETTFLDYKDLEKNFFFFGPILSLILNQSSLYKLIFTIFRVSQSKLSNKFT